jgi:DNA/RNA endonuclease YhcR with UshA esterase domain
MKRISAVALLLLSFLYAAIAQDDKTNATNAPTRIPAAEAKDHLGANAIVTGTVADVYKTETRVYLNFDKPYPNQTFTAVVFSSNTNLFTSSDLDKVKGKKVEITGKIVLYRDRPEIVINATNVFKIVGEGDTKN